MAQYAILRFEKHKAGTARALEAHHERQKELYASNPDIDTERSKYNYHIIQPRQRYRQEISDRINAAGCRTRKNSIMFVDTLITASPEFFRGRSQKEIKDFFNEGVAFMEKKIGKENIFSAVVHMDEKTPHMHLCFTPITEDGRLSATEILGYRKGLSRWQDEFHDHMKRSYPVFRRGESAYVTRRKHIPPWMFKQSVSLSKQKKDLEQAISDITLVNAGKKKEEAIAILDKFVPQLETYLGQMKKYQRTIDYLTQENQILKEKAGEKTSIKERLDAAKLRCENEQLRALVAGIPPEIREQLQKSNKSNIIKTVNELE